MRTRIELNMIKNKAIYSLIIACSFLSFLPKIYSQTLYTLADLEVLKSGKSYEEFFKHARDIIPTQRNQYWREMLSSMAIDYIDEKRSYKQFDVKTYKKIYELGSWPELMRDEFYQFKRNSYSLSYFKSCFTDNPKDVCRDQMIKYWKTAIQDLESSYQMAKLHYGFYPDASGYVYLENLLHQEEDQFYCDKPIVQNIFISHLREEHLYLKSPAQRKIYMDNLLSKSCWKKVVEPLKVALNESSPNLGRSFFFALEHNNDLSSVEYHEWMTRYFLQSPPAGELLNLSWNSLKKLGADYSLREQVLKKLQERDPLPGRIFETLNISRSQALVFHLEESFPEYIKTYAKTCLNYLEGRVSYPFGNPTPECHQLFRITSKGSTRLKNLLTGPWRDRYLKTIPGNTKSVSLR